MRALLCFIVAITAGSVAAGQQNDAQRFIDEYTEVYQKLNYEAREARWASNTKIIEGDETNAQRTRQASEKLAKFTGSIEVIEKCRAFLKDKEKI